MLALLTTLIPCFADCIQRAQLLPTGGSTEFFFGGERDFPKLTLCIMSAGKQWTLEEDGAFPGYTKWYSEHMHHVNRLFNDPQLDRMNLYTSRVAEPQYDDILQQTRLDNLHMMFRTEST